MLMMFMILHITAGLSAVITSECLFPMMPVKQVKLPMTSSGWLGESTHPQHRACLLVMKWLNPIIMAGSFIMFLSTSESGVIIINY